jgi:UDP-N-acetylmuramate--alanine ligase
MKSWRGKKIHFIGIGGIGVSSLARWFKAQGARVSGSDGSASDLLNELKKDGIRVHVGHSSSHIPKKTDLVIWSQAIREDNPERVEAAAQNIPVLSYPQMIGRLTEEYDTVAVSGAHGKSTTTAMLGLMLIAAKKDPTVIVGTKLREFKNSNFHIGKSNLLVLEADEYKYAFLNYTPAIVIVTNIDREHLEVYGTFANVKRTFLKFFGRIREGGTLILNRDDAPLFSLRPKIAAIARKKKLKVIWYSTREVLAKEIRKNILIPGRHNISNALASYHAAEVLKAGRRSVLKALSAYAGAWRRMEYRGKAGGALIYDDYAHHPTEIRATLQAFREKYPQRKILCIFQPHQAERLKRLFSDFETAFKDADQTLILPEYKVPGRDIEPGAYTSENLVKRIQKKSPKAGVFYLGDTKHLADAIRMLGPQDEKVILMMGAGPIVELTSDVLAKPASFWKASVNVAC